MSPETTLILFPILTKTGFPRQIFVTVLSLKCHGKLESVIRFQTAIYVKKMCT